MNRPLPDRAWTDRVAERSGDRPEFEARPAPRDAARQELDPEGDELRAEGGDVAAQAALSAIPGFVTGDLATVRMLRRARHFAASHLPVLIAGESGTGKELLARGVHRASARARAKWVAVNCGALPESLEESELFGARRGAFTGAVADRVGLAEEADGGTLFLDEVGELGGSAQAKLLRFLEQGEIRRLGENRVRRVDVRIVAATNRDLEARVASGAFREDLYYRLCGAPLHVPPLRRRPRDVPLLIAHLLRGVCARHGRRVPLAAGVAESLSGRRWPGNVRQLRNELERAAVIASAEGRAIRLEDFPQADAVPGPVGFHERVSAYERRLILEALEDAGGNRALAARILGGVKRTTLLGKMRRLGIDVPHGGSPRAAHDAGGRERRGADSDAC